MKYILEYLIIDEEKNYYPFLQIVRDLRVPFTCTDKQHTYYKVPNNVLVHGYCSVLSKYIHLSFNTLEDRILIQLILDGFEQYKRCEVKTNSVDWL